MKKIIIWAFLICGGNTAYTQTDSLFIKNYEKKILEISKLKNDLQTEKIFFYDLSDTYKKDTLALQKQIKDLRNEVSIEKQKVSDLNKNKIKEERDNLQMKVDSLNVVISKQNQTISDKVKQIANEKANAIITADNAKNEGRVEAFTSTVNFYKNRPFDELIKSSTKESIAREIQLLGNNLEIKLVLSDLQIYFNALELLSEKFDSIKIKNAQTQLNQIKHQSKLLEALKNDVEFYQDFNTALKEAINKLVNLDKFKLAGGDSEIQKLKFNDIVTILTDYIYNYYDYAKYTYLSDIMLEIIKRKQPNADADIIDLLKKIE